MKKNSESGIEKLIEDLNFKSVGERINTFSKALKILKAIKNGESLSEKKVPENLRFLLKLSNDELKEAYKIIKGENKKAVNNYKEMLEVFKKYGAKISKEKVAKIAYPHGFKVVEIDVGVYNENDIYGFTCDGMENWYKRNVDENTVLFKIPWDPNYEAILMKKQVFGFFIVSYYPGFTFVNPLQLAVYYNSRLVQKKGKRPKIANAHLLMLFGLLKFAKENNFDDEIRINLVFHKSKTVKKHNKEIEKIALEVMDFKYYEVAVFRKD